MNIHLVDGTYELFRHYFAVPSRLDQEGREVGGLRGVLSSILNLIENGATHIAVATDHVVESFRNELWSGYKSGEGMEEELWLQFHPLEDALRAMGVVVWPMVDVEADDGLASGATQAALDGRVDQVFICTPDKDLSQCVSGTRVVQFDRRKREVRDQTGVEERFGVPPETIPDYLALVGDSADGFPGVPGWGTKSTALVLQRYGSLDHIPADVDAWDIKVRGAQRLSENFNQHRDHAFLFRTLATLRTDLRLFDNIDELKWKQPEPHFETLAASLGAPGLWTRATKLARHNP